MTPTTNEDALAILAPFVPYVAQARRTKVAQACAAILTLGDADDSAATFLAEDGQPIVTTAIPDHFNPANAGALVDYFNARIIPAPFN